MTASIKTTAVFLRPFQLPSFNETLPAGEYEIETQLLDPVDWIEPGSWTSSVLVRLHSRKSHPGLSRTLTVPLAELENAVAKDKLTGKSLKDFFLEEMLADPMIRLVMQADGVTETELRHLYAAPSKATPSVKRKSTPQANRMAEKKPTPEHSEKAHDPGPAIDTNFMPSTQRPIPGRFRFRRYGAGATDDPIDLDGHRTLAEKEKAEKRRRPANSRSSVAPSQPHLTALEDQMLAEPARTWIEVMTKWRFLLDRYAATSDASDNRIQRHIQRALGDMERLRNREERK